MTMHKNLQEQKELEQHYIHILYPGKSEEWIQDRENALMEQYRRQAMRPFFLVQFVMYCLQNVCFVLMIPGTVSFQKILLLLLILLNAAAGCACALFAAGPSWKTVPKISQTIRFSLMASAILLNAFLIPYGIVTGWMKAVVMPSLCSLLLTGIQTGILLWLRQRWIQRG